MSTTIELSNSIPNYICYTPQLIEEISKNIQTELSPEIIVNLLEIKQNNKFIKKRSPIKLKYTMKTSIADTWRNEKLEQTISDKDKFIEELNGNLNKLSEGNYNIIKDAIKNLILENKDKYKDLLLDLIFKKSISEKTYTTLYAKLLSLLIEIYGDSFKNCILQKTKEFYEEKITINVLNDNDNDNYDILCENNKQKSKILGIFTFLGGLYENKIIEYTIIMKYFNILLESSLNTSNVSINIENYVECMVTLITKIGYKLESELEKETFDNLVMDKLVKISKDNKNYKPRTRFLIMDLIDLRNNKWKI